MYNEISSKMASYVAAGYGLSLGDLGITASANGGETLAGSIREERKTRKSLLAVLKKKYISYWNRIIDKRLEFAWIDYDDELNVAKGRARMSSATAFSQAIDKRIITPHEARLQWKRDGLITISIPEEIPMEDFDILPTGNSPVRPGEIGDPVSPSQGGHGEPEITKSTSEDAMGVVLKRSFEDLVGQATDKKISRLIHLIAPKVFRQVKGALKELSGSQEISRWNLSHEEDFPF